MSDLKVCTPKTAWLTEETYCSAHGRSSGWPCKVQEVLDQMQADGDAYLRPGSIIKGLSAHSSTDVITSKGASAGLSRLVTIVGDRHTEWELSMVMTMVARDWSHGHEDRVFASLGHYLDQTGIYQVIAAMVAHSQSDSEPAEQKAS